MNEAEVKKLKVAELRCRLKAAGLDSRGLKAELVTRLWAAIQEGPLRETDDNTAVISSPVPAEPTEAVQPRVAPAAADPGAAAPCCPVGSREFTDSGTQTEAHAGGAAPQPGSECGSEPVESSRAEGEAVSLGETEGGDKGRAFYEFKEEIRYKRAKSPPPPVDRDDTEEWNEDQVCLNPYDSHLHFEPSPDGSCGQPRFWAQFPALWSGSRLSHGVLRGSVGFEVRLERKLPTTQLEEQQVEECCGVRVGWSATDASLLLGEDELSFAYDGRGTKVSTLKEEEYGETLSEGDIVGCYASFSTDGAVEISFHKNGRSMGVAFSPDATALQGRPLFPHVLCKNCSVRFLLDPAAPPWYPGPAGFTPLASLAAELSVRSSLGPCSKAQCEVLLMVGLPGSGKTHWARTHMKQNPEKRYRLLGAEELLKCAISGGQRDSRLRQATQCLTEIIKMAAQTPANYILDQCNILFSARRHKLQLFTGFRRRAVVVFPSADEWKRRLTLHGATGGERIPEIALLKLQVSCSLPEQQQQQQDQDQDQDLLEELQYQELPEDQARTLLQEYKNCARRLLPPVPAQTKQPRLYRKRPRLLGPHPPPHKIQWNGKNGWSDPRLVVQPWCQSPSYWNVNQSYGYKRSLYGYW